MKGQGLDAIEKRHRRKRDLSEVGFGVVKRGTEYNE